MTSVLTLATGSRTPTISRRTGLCDVRVEAIEPLSKPTPRCVGGSGRQGDSRYYKTDEIIALFDVIDKVATANETATVGDIGPLIEHYEAVRFSRQSVNKQLKESFPGLR